MDQLKRQVDRARRRLLAQQFLAVVPWALFGMLLAAVVALAIPKIWALGPAEKAWAYSGVWMWSWIGGSVAAALVIALLVTILFRRTQLDAAVEIDRRFALKERVSSTLALHEHERESEAGQALIADAVRRVERVDVPEQFRVRARWWTLLPLLPALVVFVLAVLVPDAVREADQASAAPTTVRRQINRSAEELKKRLAERRKKAEEQGLADAGDLFRKLEQGADRLAQRDQTSRKEALVKLNELSKELEKRRQQLGDAEKMRQQFNKLKDMKKGPADSMADALKQGDFQKALNELKDLQQQLQGDKLTDEQREQLAGQLDQMADKLNDIADAQQQAKQDLEQRIADAMKAGDMDQVNKLQQQLDKLAMQDAKMDQLRDLAQKMNQCSDCCKNGDCQGAANQLGQMADQLQQMQGELDELAMIDDAMDQIGQCKNGMCAGGGGAGNKNGPPGPGMGEGQGAGARPEQENDTGSYDSRVRGNVTQGEAVVVDSVRGPNVAGNSREAIKESIESAQRDTADPLTGQRLPRAQREHAQQYFDQFQGDD